MASLTNYHISFSFVGTTNIQLFMCSCQPGPNVCTHWGFIIRNQINLGAVANIQPKPILNIKRFLLNFSTRPGFCTFSPTIYSLLVELSLTTSITHRSHIQLFTPIHSKRMPHEIVSPSFCCLMGSFLF
jgi:hypothetical protein